eukprot:g35216.t1
MFSARGLQSFDTALRCVKATLVQREFAGFCLVGAQGRLICPPPLANLRSFPHGSQAELCRILGIHRTAVTSWKENIPAAREKQLRGLKPEWFESSASPVQSSSSN